jgi:tetratricopeptide (TPR) repeat protein
VARRHRRRLCTFAACGSGARRHDADRLAVYKEFRVQYDAAAVRRRASAGRKKLVKLTEEQYGPDELVLAKPLTNLATVDYKLGNYSVAIENYQRTLRILQAKSTLADKQQIAPAARARRQLHGRERPGSPRWWR